jgi:hypothetical protein
VGGGEGDVPEREFGGEEAGGGRMVGGEEVVVGEDLEEEGWIAVEEVDFCVVVFDGDGERGLD